MLSAIAIICHLLLSCHCHNHILFKLAVGMLVCKGIVEIVVLTTGLNAGTISTKVYSMFIFMALISTFITTPLTVWLFPASYREDLKSRLDNTEGEAQQKEPATDIGSFSSLSDLENHRISRIVTVLNKPESVFFTISLLNHLVSGQKYAQEKGTTAHLGRRSDMAHSIKNAGKPLNLEDADDGNLEKQVTFVNSADSIQLRTVYFRLLTDRTTDLLQNLPSHDTQRPDKDYSGDSCLNTLNMFSELANVAHSGELVFSLLGDKNSHINEIPTATSDLLLFPMNGVSETPSEKFKECLAHMLAQNELDENFLQSVASNARSNLAFFISNSNARERMTIPKKTSFYLLLTEEVLTSSDYLSLDLLLLILSKVSSEPSNPSQLAIYVNDCNNDFITRFCSRYKIARRQVEVVSIGLQNQTSSTEESLPKSAFVDAVLQRISQKEDSTLEGSLFLMADSSFSQNQSFGHEVEMTIMRSFTKHFDLLICHSEQM